MKTYDKQIGINEGLWEFCKYQNSLLEKYKEFIEKTILVKIIDQTKPHHDYFGVRGVPEGEVQVREVTIPETRFFALETPNIQRQWNILQWDRPLIQPEVFVRVLYEAKESQDKNDTKAD